MQGACTVERSPELLWDPSSYPQITSSSHTRDWGVPPNLHAQLPYLFRRGPLADGLWKCGGVRMRNCCYVFPSLVLREKSTDLKWSVSSAFKIMILGDYHTEVKVSITLWVCLTFLRHQVQTWRTRLPWCSEMYSSLKPWELWAVTNPNTKKASWAVNMESGHDVTINSGWFWKTCTIQRAMFHETSKVGAGRDCSRYLAQIPKAQKSMPCNLWFGFIFFTKEMFCFNFKSFWSHAECYGKVPELSRETESPETERGNVYLRYRPSTPTLDTYSSFPVLASPLRQEGTRPRMAGFLPLGDVMTRIQR